MNLKSQVIAYQPFNEQEVMDKDFFLRFMETFDDVLTRNNIFGHFTASAFVVNEEKTKMLVLYHNIYDGWIYPGGHADGEEDLLKVAVREVYEETGLKVKVLDENFYAIQTLPVVGHIKRGKYVSSHVCLDVVFLFEAKETDKLIIKEDENQGIKWVLFKDAFDDSMVDYIRPIHKKLVKKLTGKDY